MVDLTAYKAAFPEFVDIKEPIGPWSVYLWNGILLQIVGQRKDGSIVRHQDTNEEQAAEMSPDEHDPYCEVYASLEAMIASDKYYEEHHGVMA